MRASKLPLFTKAKAIPDSEIALFIDSKFKNNFSSKLDDRKISSLFISRFKDWINSNLFQLKGLDKFPYIYLSYGVTESLPYIYLLERNKKVHLLPGEYPFHKTTLSQLRFNLTTNIESINEKSFFILSVPFSATGNLNHIDTIAKFNKKKASILIDFAMYGLQESFYFDLNQYESVNYLTFSLSKVFNLGRNRIGITFSKKHIPGLSSITEWDYTNRIGSYIGYELMHEFSINYLYKKYRSRQIEYCKNLDLTPSDIILFGLSHNPKYSEFSRDGIVNRVCLSDHLICKSWT